MPKFAIRTPYFIVVVCLIIAVVGINTVKRMPVDMFPPINLPQVVVATFYSGMPPQDVELTITSPLERFFTMASGIDHTESRSMLGISGCSANSVPATANRPPAACRFVLIRMSRVRSAMAAPPCMRMEATEPDAALP